MGDNVETAVAEPTPALPSLHCRVQSHPSRRELRQRLLARIDGMPVEIIETAYEPSNPWYGYLECLRDIPAGVSHLLIVQDDAIACRNLTPALEAIAQVEGEVPVCLYLGCLPPNKRPALLAGKEGKRFVDLLPNSFLPVVAVLWPVPLARSFYEWGVNPATLRHRNGLPFVERSDDAMGGRWMRTMRQRVVATIPSLIEHPDDIPSTIGRKPGGRTALFWHGTEWDATSIEWI